MQKEIEIHIFGRIQPLSGGGVAAGLQLMLIVLCLTCSASRPAEFIPTGVPEIDAMRKDFAVNPTTQENAPFFYGLDAFTGKPLWIYTFDQRVEESTLCIHRDMVFVLAGDGYVYAIN